MFVLSTVNAQSIVNKHDSLEAHIYTHSPDVVALTETWLREFHSDDCICPHGYHIFRCDRVSTSGGGVALLVKSKFQTKVLKIDAHLEYLIAEIISSYLKLILAVCYRSQKTSPSDFFSSLHSDIDTLMSSTQYNGLVCTGDFNCPEIDWSIVSSSCSSHENFINFVVSRNLRQLVREPTRCENILDLVLVSPAFHDSSSIVFPGISDHKCVLTYLNFPTPPKRQCKKMQIYDFDRMDRTAIREHLASVMPQFADMSLSTPDVNFLWESFTEVLSTCLHHVPKRLKTIKKRNPWIDRDVIHLKRKCRRLRKRKNKNPNIMSNLFKQIAQIEKQIKLMIKEKHRTYVSSTLQNFIKNSPNKFWQHKQR